MLVKIDGDHLVMASSGAAFLSDHLMPFLGFF